MIQVREVERLSAIAGVGEHIMNATLPYRGSYDEANVDGKALFQLRTGAGKAAAAELKRVVLEMFDRCGAGELFSQRTLTKGRSS